MRYTVLLFILGIGFLLLGSPGDIRIVGMQIRAPMNVTIASYIDFAVSSDLSERIEFTKGAAGRGFAEPVDPNTNDNNATWNWNGTGSIDTATLYYGAISSYTNELTVDVCSNADNDLWDLPMQHFIGIANVTFASSLLNDNNNPSLPGVQLVITPLWVTTYDDLTPPLTDYNYTYLRYWFDSPAASSEIPPVQYNTTYVIKAIRGVETC